MHTPTTPRRTVVVYRATALFSRITAALLIAAPWLVPPLAIVLGLAAGAMYLSGGGGVEEIAVTAAPDIITAPTDPDCVMFCTPTDPAAPPPAPALPVDTGTNCVMFCATDAPTPTPADTEAAKPSPVLSAATALVTGFGAL